MSYGEFRNDFTEYVVHEPAPVHVIDNYLWNDKVLSHVTQTGLGYLWYDHQGTEITRLTPGGECESAYDKFYNRVIYVRDNRTGEVFNLNWEPIGGGLDHFSCVHGLGYSTITAKKKGIEVELRLFVPPGSDPLEIWQLELRNRSGRKRDLSVFVYNEVSFQSVDTYGERVFMHGELDRTLNAILCTKRAEWLPHDHFTVFLASDRKMNRFDCSRPAFLGPTAMMNRPAAVERGRCSNSAASCENPVTAAQYDLKLAARR
ncbi:MAG: hypothetical protein JRI23_11610, partial [Deltaproteobacteria bacterium]|nr:hypothetical protein [Deltaproteobacteria bacterium]MBW2532345.1 hypothetical protein [Deltaproteobacteria bacterium]